MTARRTKLQPAVDQPAGRDVEDVLVAKEASTESLVTSIPFNSNKAAEYGESSIVPRAGVALESPDAAVTGSTVTEIAPPTAKLGAGEPELGDNPNNGPLDRVRVDSGGRTLTTNQGVPIATNQHSLKAGFRGPALLEDFILREKITHFDHERIPERIVHARGSGAHGYFECYESLRSICRASVFSEAGKRTPVFVRFSTVLGERGSADTVRDPRGFAVKFYSDEGNWDLVGNNIPVFFIQDAMKFPDLVHAAKPEPHFAMPQAASAHDTFWDFASLMPESTHMLLWVMSDRALPRSYRMMQGFGVHTFRFLNEAGDTQFVKFHWEPVAGTHSLGWDECIEIAGADPDFHRRDLWEAIEAGDFPRWELGVQVFSEQQAEAFSFDVLDATKIVPEELVPVRRIGRLVLDRNPDNFFAETEQVAFCPAHLVPGIDFSNDPLLAGRIHSYQDTQLLRLGGANFHEIPINAPVAQVHNNQRDGFHRQAIHRGRVAYEPNSLAGGNPSQAGGAGFVSFREPILADKVRGHPEKFSDHFTQATLFWNSQSRIEQTHIVNAFRFELTKVQTRAIRTRVVSMLANASLDLAQAVAEGLGMEMPLPMPKTLESPIRPEVVVSATLSLFARPGDSSIATRRIAILAADGVDGEGALWLHEELSRAGARPQVVALRLGLIRTLRGEPLEIEATFETTPSVLYDAVVIPDGEACAEGLGRLDVAIEFIRDQYRHGKTILAVGAGEAVLEKANIAARLPSGAEAAGILVFPADGRDVWFAEFENAVSAHRHFERETNPGGA